MRDQNPYQPPAEEDDVIRSVEDLQAIFGKSIPIVAVPPIPIELDTEEFLRELVAQTKALDEQRRAAKDHIMSELGIKDVSVEQLLKEDQIGETE